MNILHDQHGRCPRVASPWDMLAQDWQKTTDSSAAVVYLSLSLSLSMYLSLSLYVYIYIYTYYVYVYIYIYTHTYIHVCTINIMFSIFPFGPLCEKGVCSKISPTPI